jgi:hypothetical protein
VHAVAEEEVEKGAEGAHSEDDGHSSEEEGSHSEEGAQPAAPAEGESPPAPAASPEGEGERVHPPRRPVCPRGSTTGDQ